MSSNEEYLDSLLRAVTGQAGEMPDKKPDNGIEKEFILDEPVWDEDLSDNEPDAMDSFEVNPFTMEDNGREPEPVSDDSKTEQAFLDPGSLFFEGEEEVGDDDMPEDALEEEVLTADEPEEPFFKEEEERSEEEGAIDDTETELNGDVVEEPILDEPVLEETDLDEVNLEEADLEELNSEELSDLTDLTEGLEEGDGFNSDEEELEDLILAADSVEETLEDGFQEISDLLAGGDSSDEEMLAMLGDVEESGVDIGFLDEEPEDLLAEVMETEITETEAENTGSSEENKKKAKRKSKKAKNANLTEDEEKTSDESEGKAKKTGVFAKFVNFLLEEDEDEEAEKSEADIDDLLMGEATDENAAILAELDKEKTDKNGKKKGKKDKKGKKGKEKEKNGEKGEEDEDSEAVAKNDKRAAKERKKKEKQEKKEQKKAERLSEEPTKKISVKKIEAVVIFCLTIAAAIVLAVHLVPPSLEKAKARDAYYAKDYKRVVENFYGEKLNDSDAVMYERAATILKFQRKVDAYNNYMYMGKETEALNQLIEAIFRYEEVYEDAVAYNVIGEIDGMYQTVLDALQNRYGLSISRAMEIYAIEDDFEYTLMLESIISGIEYPLPSESEGQDEAQFEEQPEGQDENQFEEQPEGQDENQFEEQPEGQDENQPEE